MKTTPEEVDVLRLQLMLMEVVGKLETDVSVRPLRVMVNQRGVLAQVTVWDSRRPMPTVANGVEDAAPPLPKFNDCEKDAFAVVSAAKGTRLTAGQIADRLQAAKKLHGGSTLSKALGRLVRLGWLTNSRDRRGYSLGPQAR